MEIRMMKIMHVKMNLSQKHLYCQYCKLSNDYSVHQQKKLITAQFYFFSKSFFHFNYHLQYC